MPISPHSTRRLRQLRAFCLAAETGSISLAAGELQISQPSVSLLIKSLEEDMHVGLFERRGPKINLTSQGRLLHEISAPLVEKMDHIEELFTTRLGQINAGTIDIAAGSSTLLYVLPHFVTSFHEHYEQVEIHLHQFNGHDALSQLRRGEVDFMVGSLLKIPEDINYSELESFRQMLITPRGHPLTEQNQITLKDISQYKLILPPVHSDARKMIDTVFHQHGIKYEISLEVTGWENIKKYVSLGVGISIVSELCLTGDESLTEFALDQFFPSRSYGIMMRRGNSLKPQARKFIEMMDKDIDLSEL